MHLGVGRGDESAQAGAQLIERLVLALVVAGGMCADPVPQINHDRGDAGIGSGGVRHGLISVEVQQQPALVAKRDAVPVTGLADDAGGRDGLGRAVEPRGDAAGALAGGG